MKRDIFDLLRGLEKKSGEINTVFHYDDFLDEEISIIWVMIEEGYGLTSSDKSSDILYNFGRGIISKKQAQSKLKKLLTKK